jgi:hypothetical protein
MYAIDPTALTQALVEEHLREARGRRRSAECGQQPATASRTEQVRRHPRLWRLVHVRHAYS